MDHKSAKELAEKVERARKLVRVGGKYRHYKGGEYKIIGIALHSETLEEMVIYQPLYKTGAEFWVRPLKNFLERVEIEGKRLARFTLLSSSG